MVEENLVEKRAQKKYNFSSFIKSEEGTGLTNNLSNFSTFVKIGGRGDMIEENLVEKRGQN